MEIKLTKGETVIERTRPTNRLIISRFNNGLVYCKTAEDPNRKELVYFERELRPVVNQASAAQRD